MGYLDDWISLPNHNPPQPFFFNFISPIPRLLVLIMPANQQPHEPLSATVTDVAVVVVTQHNRNIKAQERCDEELSSLVSYETGRDVRYPATMTIVRIPRKDAVSGEQSLACSVVD